MTSQTRMETMDDILVSFHGRGKLKHHIMTYLSILFLSIILSWLLTKLVETSHDLTRHWEWNHVRLAVRHYPRKHRKKKKAR